MIVLVLVVGGREIDVFFSFICEKTLKFYLLFSISFYCHFPRVPISSLSLSLPEVIFPLLPLLVLFAFKPLFSVRCYVQPSLGPVFSILALMLNFLFLGVIFFLCILVKSSTIFSFLQSILRLLCHCSPHP